MSKEIRINQVNGEHYIEINGFDLDSIINKMRNMPKEVLKQTEKNNGIAGTYSSVCL